MSPVELVLGKGGRLRQNQYRLRSGTVAAVVLVSITVASARVGVNVSASGSVGVNFRGGVVVRAE